MTRTSEKIQRPCFVEDNHLQYLDALRESGVTNMFGAVPYLTEMFPTLTRLQARKVLLYWMQTFAQENR
jgi:hypothetical protein